MVHELFTVTWAQNCKRYLNLCIYLFSAFYRLYEMQKIRNLCKLALVSYVVHHNCLSSTGRSHALLEAYSL